MFHHQCPRLRAAIGFTLALPNWVPSFPAQVLHSSFCSGHPVTTQSHFLAGLLFPGRGERVPSRAQKGERLLHAHCQGDNRGGCRSSQKTPKAGVWDGRGVRCGNCTIIEVIAWGCRAGLPTMKPRVGVLPHLGSPCSAIEPGNPNLIHHSVTATQ